MSRSSKPSPFTSPALDTETPELSYSSMPSSRKPVVPSKVERSSAAPKPLDFPNTT